MDLQGSLLDTNLRIYPSSNFLNYLKSIELNDDVPINIMKFVKGRDYNKKQERNEDTKTIPIHLDGTDIENLNKIIATIKVEEVLEDEEPVKPVNDSSKEKSTKKSKDKKQEKKAKENSNEKTKKSKEDCNETTKDKIEEKEDDLHLNTSDIDWLYGYLQKLRNNGGKNIPYLHSLLEGAKVEIPKNEVIQRNPVLEARCVKLRAQQEAREYRKMTKHVDNVRMRFPEDSISYQMKQLNRQMIAIGQFIISIFAGFLFGFKGLEWMIGSLDFGFRLLMGVMCALIIALAEIYFLAKKLNEELSIPEPVQIGGPTKFADGELHMPNISNKAVAKDHQD